MPPSFWRPSSNGYETSVNMYKWIAEGAEPDKAIFTSGVLMTRDNYKQIRQEMGLE